VVIRITDPYTDPDPDPDRDTGKTCSGGGMHCCSASSSVCFCFSKINISQGSVATRLRCGGIFHCPLLKFIAKSAAEKILKIG